jgi:pseudaminic acid cytidylyltransferase
VQIAIVPARGGSKRIPRKNVRDFAGRPMIAWPLAAARESGLFDRIVVSTDDDEIAAVAEAAGGEVPFRRPPGLSDDITPTRRVINHAVDEVERLSGGRVATVCCLYATAAFVTAPDLVAARRMLDGAPGRRFVFAAARYPHPIQRAMRLRRDGGVEMFFPEAAGARSQDLPEAFHDAGQFYWGGRDSFLENHPMFAAHSHPFVLPEGRTRDIDAPEDWDLAEQLFMLARGCGHGP